MEKLRVLCTDHIRTETQKQPNQPIDDGNRWGELSQSQGLDRETVTISALGRAMSTVCDQGNYTGHDA